MKLMQELMTNSQPVAEASFKDAGGYSRFMRVSNIVDKELDHLNAVFKEGSQFEKLSLPLGGNASEFAAIREALGKVEDLWAELQMSVGMSQQEDPNE